MTDSLTHPLVIVAQIFIKSEAVLKALALLKMFDDNVVQPRFPLSDSFPRQCFKLFNEGYI